MIRLLKVGDYTISQSWNYDVSIYKDGKMVLHAIRHEKCSDDELLEILQAYTEMREVIDEI